MITFSSRSSTHSLKKDFNKQIDLLSSLLNKGQEKSIIVLQGAGVSVAAGIPDFRSPNSGLYSQLSYLNLPSPESIFDIEYFAENPKPFYQIASKLISPLSFKPTSAHYF